ncbi:MAG: mevalonate kinase [Candidatus Aminicenantaceae bacterium]
MKVEGRAFARAGILGNPSDGYFGKIIAVSVKNFAAEVVLEESDTLRIGTPDYDDNSFDSLENLVDSVTLYGYYGGVRLVKAGIKRFYEHCRDQGIRLAARNFTLNYSSTIPRQLGLGGSSAILTAAMRALMTFYEVDIPEHVLPTLILEAERDELGINAGFMDRVIQVYEGCVFMDLDREAVQTQGFGRYERLDPKTLPPFYLAYKPALGKVSGRVLNPIREGFERGDPDVLAALVSLASLAEQGKAALLLQDHAQIRSLMDANFDLRRRIMPISEDNLSLIRSARACGASAKFAGSGGSLIGVYDGEDMYQELVNRLGRLDAVVTKPVVV